MITLANGRSGHLSAKAGAHHGDGAASARSFPRAGRFAPSTAAEATAPAFHEASGGSSLTPMPSRMQMNSEADPRAMTASLRRDWKTCPSFPQSSLALKSQRVPIRPWRKHHPSRKPESGWVCSLTCLAIHFALCINRLPLIC